ncbi:MaoC family dehydratase N-terminal domain-containing protein [Streptomyces sp. NPDC046805]|uniref:FAS1-like dehydratase domain-containing protein n=1 Tax=Streptomyces sp. NPDC046805 TaxID=3155134 RepID=UPI0033D46F62
MTDTTAKPAYPPVVTSVDADRVAAFAAATSADPALGVPPAFAAVYTLAATMPQVLADEALGIDLSRALHGEQEFTWTDHPREGEALVASGRIVEDVNKGDKRMVMIETAVTGDGSRPVCVSRMLLVIR